MQPTIYLDWNASAPLAPAARLAMADAMEAMAAAGLNPSSQHTHGRNARLWLEKARKQVAALAHATHDQITFTAGATEAANWVFTQQWDAVVVSALEHDCIRAAAHAAEQRGVIRRDVPALAVGAIDLSALDATLSALTDAGASKVLVAVMAANNETGALQPYQQAAQLAHTHGAAFLVDAAQALGKMAFNFSTSGADFAIVSGHKIGAPAGIGALIQRGGGDLRPMIVGGGQESRRRAGTENILGAIGFGAAAANFDASAWRAAAEKRDLLENTLSSGAKGLVFFAPTIDRLPTTSCVAAPGWRAETQLMQFDLAGFAVSAGSACSSGKLAASHVLRAMGADDELATSAIRISFGPQTPQSDLDRFAETYLRLWSRAASK
ncbi:MAG: aminotransferase class V-fold PLP-dependent enzyme [Neomegalonema sp.]|nr:aminotransferase class V-fold PLP-dependent enzyme [Neomegalonema sp.]